MGPWSQGPTSSLLTRRASGDRASWDHPLNSLKPSWSRLSYHPVMMNAGASMSPYRSLTLYAFQKSSKV